METLALPCSGQRWAGDFVGFRVLGVCRIGCGEACNSPLFTRRLYTRVEDYGSQCIQRLMLAQMKCCIVFSTQPRSMYEWTKCIGQGEHNTNLSHRPQVCRESAAVRLRLNINRERLVPVPPYAHFHSCKLYDISAKRW